MLTLAFDRPGQSLTGAATRYLRLRLSPAGRFASRPVDVLVLLDASSSMRGEPFARAKQACVTLAAALRPEDRLDLATFHGTVNPVCEGLGGEGVAAVLARALDGVATGYGTRLDLGLAWLQGRATARPGRHRIAVLVTDGYPFDADRRPVRDFAPLEAQAAALGEAGLVMSAIGLGPAEAFNSGLLATLAQRTRGAFRRADTAAALATLLPELLAPAQDVAEPHAVLSLAPALKGLRPDGAWRIAPSFAPLRLEARGDGWEVPLGAVERDGDTDVLLALHVPGPGFLSKNGPRKIVEVGVTLVGARAQEAATLDFTHDSERLLRHDPGVELCVKRLRLHEGIERLKADSSSDPHRTRALGAIGDDLDAMARLAADLGAVEALRELAALRAEMERDGRISDRILSGLLEVSTGRLHRS